MPKGPKRLTGISGRVTRAQQRTVGQGHPTRTQSIKRNLHKIGDADISLKNIGQSTSSGFRRVGRFMENRPGLTGTAVVGGGAGGTYYLLSRKENKS
jgi:hypothetical protein